MISKIIINTISYSLAAATEASINNGNKFNISKFNILNDKQIEKIFHTAQNDKNKNMSINDIKEQKELSPLASHIVDILETIYNNKIKTSPVCVTILNIATKNHLTAMLTNQYPAEKANTLLNELSIIVEMLEQLIELSPQYPILEQLIDILLMNMRNSYLSDIITYIMKIITIYSKLNTNKQTIELALFNEMLQNSCKMIELLIKHKIDDAYHIFSGLESIMKSDNLSIHQLECAANLISQILTNMQDTINKKGNIEEQYMSLSMSWKCGVSHLQEISDSVLNNMPANSGEYVNQCIDIIKEFEQKKALKIQEAEQKQKICNEADYDDGDASTEDGLGCDGEVEVDQQPTIIKPEIKPEINKQKEQEQKKQEEQEEQEQKKQKEQEQKKQKEQEQKKQEEQEIQIQTSITSEKEDTSNKGFLLAFGFMSVTAAVAGGITYAVKTPESKPQKITQSKSIWSKKSTPTAISAAA